MTAEELFEEAANRGLRLERRGNNLSVRPRNRLTPDFADALRRHKGELLDLLEAKTASLPSDCAPWLHVAKQILAGEFDGADRSTRESLRIGLRSINHPLCHRALEQLGNWEAGGEGGFPPEAPV
jgi:hypothetical protein